MPGQALKSRRPRPFEGWAGRLRAALWWWWVLLSLRVPQALGFLPAPPGLPLADGVARRCIDLAVVLGLPPLCGYLGAEAGRDLNWDQLNYHVYVAHAFLHDRLALDFSAASVQSYLNPLGHLPFYAAANGPWDSWTAAALLGCLHGLALSFLYLAGRQLTSAMPRYTHVMSLAIVAMALTHPVLLAELGSSLAEIVALVPMMAAVYALCRARRPAAARQQLLWLAIGYALAGVAVALKLAFAVFVPGLLVFAVADRATWRLRLLAIAIAAVALGAGWYAGGGFWHVRVAAAFGNPFFPFFNDIFRSPDHPAVALANHRVVGRGIEDLVRMPLRMLTLRPFVTTERIVVDPRYASVFGLLLVALVLAIRRRAVPRGGLALLGFFGVSYVAWVFSSGNGRYALPLHLVCGLVAAHLCMQIWQERRQAAAALVAGAGLCVACALAFGGLAHWTRAQHGPQWHELQIPDAARADDGLYLSVGYFDRSSLSFLVPSLPAAARFINVNGYANPAPDGPGGQRIAAMITAHRGSLRVIAEGVFPKRNAQAAQSWLGGINRNLEGFGVRLDDPQACVVVRMRYWKISVNGEFGVPIASICPLQRVPAVDHRREKAAVDALFDTLEREHPTRLYPPHETSYFRGDGYCRFYAPLEYYLCEEQGDVTVVRLEPRETLLRRSLEPR